MLSKLITPLLLVLILLIPCQRLQASQKDETKNILIIFSLNQGLVAYQILLENFKNILREEYSEPYKLYVEYLNVEDFPDTNYQRYIFNRINEKYKDIVISLLILGGPRIIPLIETYASDYIKDLPTILNDICNPYEKDPKHIVKPNTLEILECFNFKKNFELAFSLFPDCSTVYIISGASKTDKFFYKLTMKAAQAYEKQKRIVSLINLSVNEIIEKVKDIPKNSIILVPTFLVDINNVGYNTPEVIRLIHNSTSAPIFVIFDTAFDDGAFGGYVSSQAMVGIECGKSAIKILNGQKPNTLHVNSENLETYMFDWLELKSQGLENSKLIPANSIILNKEYDFFDTNKWLLLGALLFILLQTYLIVNLVRLNRKQKSATLRLIESENHYRQLIREDRILRMGELTASLSHELNQPLTAIRNSAQAGLRFMNAEKLDPEMMNEILQNIVDDNKRAAEVLSSIRQMLKLEKREKQKLDLNVKIKQVVEMFRGEINEKNIQLKLNLPEKPVYILGDKTQIQQVLLNLVTNAAYATEEDGSRKNIIEVNEIIEDEKVIVSVRDNGKGIDKKIQDNLFRPFMTTKEKGFGIGLAISKSIIDDHGGKIWAENNTDGGATFSFQLNLINNV